MFNICFLKVFAPKVYDFTSFVVIAREIDFFFFFLSVGTEREIEIGDTRTKKAATRGAAKEDRDKNVSFTETKR